MSCFGDQRERVVDELSDQLRWHGAIEQDGVPVLLVHVVAGNDAFVFLAKGDRAFGVAFQIHARGELIRHRRGEHLAADLVNEHVGAEGSGFLTAGFRQAMGGAAKNSGFLMA